MLLLPPRLVAWTSLLLAVAIGLPVGLNFICLRKVRCCSITSLGQRGGCRNGESANHSDGAQRALGIESSTLEASAEGAAVVAG